MITANIVPTAISDGISYASAVPLTTTEASLGDGLKSPDPIPVIEGQSIIVVAKLTINGLIVGNNTYLVLQTDLGDGTWIDMAWVVWNGTQGTATFVLCGGVSGSANSTFQQSRPSGSPPAVQANGANVVPLGGRCRVVGKSTAVGGSSSISGTTAGVSATLTYKLLTPR